MYQEIKCLTDCGALIFKQGKTSKQNKDKTGTRRDKSAGTKQGHTVQGQNRDKEGLPQTFVLHSLCIAVPVLYLIVPVFSLLSLFCPYCPSFIPACPCFVPACSFFVPGHLRHNLSIAPICCKFGSSKTRLVEHEFGRPNFCSTIINLDKHCGTKLCITVMRQIRLFVVILSCPKYQLWAIILDRPKL